MRCVNLVIKEQPWNNHFINYYKREHLPTCNSACQYHRHPPGEREKCPFTAIWPYRRPGSWDWDYRPDEIVID